ncbi:GABA permease, partial [Pandoraea pneumonica]
RLERESPGKLKIRMWGYPYLTWVAIIGMLSIVGAMAFIPDQRTPLALGVVSLTVLLVAFTVRSIWRKLRSSDPEFDSPV